MSHIGCEWQLVWVCRQNEFYFFPNRLIFGDKFFCLVGNRLIVLVYGLFQDSMQCAMDFLKSICRWIMQSSVEDLKFMEKRVDKHVVDRLQLIAEGPFEKITYTEAVKVLKQVKIIT